MSLTPGTRVGPYEVVSALGAGGMGEVYRARDSRLGRDVALKILPDAFADDADRLMRFEREARTLATLNHPHIAQIHGIEETASTRALVMELVDGEDLAHRTTRGPIPLDEAVTIAKQIVEALEAAHEAGIIHRDLKPANIKVRHDGTVKVLDFGLAKMGATGLSDEARSEKADATVTSPAMTHAGLILGTAAYMAPEQAKGKTVDKRADIWAFGCVLFEMLTGQRPFDGEDVTDTIVAVMSREPPWTILADDVPAGVRRLIARCLVKNPHDRLRDIGEARIALQNATAEPSDAIRTPFAHGSRRIVIAAVLIAAAIAAAAGWMLATRASRPTSTTGGGLRAVIDPQPAAGLERLTLPAFALTPDGQEIVFAGTADGVRSLYRRQLDQSAAIKISGTEGAAAPFLSPNGRFVGFWADGALKRVPLNGGAIVTIHDLQSAAPDTLALGWGSELGAANIVAYGATWLPDDTIVYGRFVGGLWQVPASGGMPKPLTTINTSAGELAHRLPNALPGSNAILFTVQSAMLGTRNSIEAFDLESGTRRKLVDDASDARYAGTGHLLFARRGSLFAQPFDPRSFTISGEPVRVLPDVMHAVGGNSPGRASGVAQFGANAAGMLAFLPGGMLTERTWTVGWLYPGKPPQPIDIEPRSYLNPRLSPDGEMIAVSGKGPDDTVNHLFLVDPRRATATVLLREGTFAIWTPDGRRLITAFQSGGVQGQHLYSVPVAGGEPERILESKYPAWPSSVSGDGRFLAYVESNPTSGNDVWVLGLNPAVAPRPLVKTSANEAYPTFSPDGRLIAFTSTESGRQEAYVQPFPSGGRHVQVSRGGARNLSWARDGKSLVFVSGPSKLMAVAIEGGPSLRAGEPRVLADIPLSGTTPVGSFDMTKDGGFLIAYDRDPAPMAVTLTQLQIVVNALARRRE
jgi:serine/threonine-protein kinase